MRNMFCGLTAAFVLALGLTACDGGSGPTVVGQDHQVVVVQSRDDLIRAGGYGYVNDVITPANFPISAQPKHDETMVLVSFNREISSENAVAEMKARKLRPANLDECLAFGATISDTHADYWIVCLGQSAVVGGYRLVPALDDGDGELDLGWWGGGWASDRRFLAVRN